MNNTPKLHLESNILYYDILLIIEDFLIYKNSIPITWYLIFSENGFILSSYENNSSSSIGMCKFDLIIKDIILPFNIIEERIYDTIEKISKNIYAINFKSIIKHVNIIIELFNDYLKLFFDHKINILHVYVDIFIKCEICNEKSKKNWTNYYKRYFDIINYINNTISLNTFINDSLYCRCIKCNKIICDNCISKITNIILESNYEDIKNFKFNYPYKILFEQFISLPITEKELYFNEYILFILKHYYPCCNNCFPS